MKNLIYLLFIPVLLLFSVSCEDEEAVRVPEFEEAATMRIQVDPQFGSMNFANLEEAKIVFSLFTVNDNLDRTEIYLDYYNFAQDSTYETKLWKTFEQGDFNSEGAIRDVTLTSQDMVEFLGISMDDVSGGDRLDFSNFTYLDDGRVFPDTVLQGTDFENLNVTPNIINSAATTSFSVGFTAYVACPVPDGFATGTYKLEQTAGPADPFFGGDVRWATEEITLTAESPIERSFEGTYLTFDGRGFNFLLICGNVVVAPTGSGLSCSGNELIWQADAPPGTYNETNDDEITIKLLDNINGACGVAANESLTLKLTKVE